MCSKRLILILSIMLAVLPESVFAEKTEQGVGLAYGQDHAYFLTAPPGWILDTESGAEQGIFAVFYPRGSDWNGPIAMYSNAAAREGRTQSAAIEKDEQAMRVGNLKLTVTEGQSLTTRDNKKAIVRYFSGDSHGNYEAAGYVIEKNVVANIILTARTKTGFTSALPAFKQLVESYRFVSDDPSKLDLAALARAEHLKTNQTLPTFKK